MLVRYLDEDVENGWNYVYHAQERVQVMRIAR